MSPRGRSTDRSFAGRSGSGRADGVPARSGAARSGGAPDRPRGARRDRDRRGDLVATKERVRAVIDPVIAAAGYDLEDLSISRAGRRHVVRVLVDGDGGVSLDDIAEVSRAVSTALDLAEETGGELITGEYQLEVGSPGVDRPLTQPRHWRRNVGRLVKVQVSGDAERQLAGRVLAADAEGIVLEASGQPHQLAYGQLGPGRVQIEFTRLDEVAEPDINDIADPTDDVGADDEELEDEER